MLSSIQLIRGTQGIANTWDLHIIAMTFCFYFALQTKTAYWGILYHIQSKTSPSVEDVICSTNII